jgi:DNA-directed RNA polymerase specialized sigma24 family protein
VSTRFQPQTRAWGARRATAPEGSNGFDPAEDVALVARAKRELLLRAHRHRLRREELEDCYSQATIELVTYVRGTAKAFSRRHLANILEQRFLSRIHDRRRALSGRSPMQAALESAVSLASLEEAQIEIVDLRADPEQLAILRHELRHLQQLVAELSRDQQLVLASQIGLQMGRGEFCRRFGWSAEKYRKVAQRARARLRQLIAEEAYVPPSRQSSEGKTGTPYEPLSPRS